jgi:hypothetical protein
MAPDRLALQSSTHDSVVRGRSAGAATVLPEPRRQAARRADDRAFFDRVARTNRAQSDLIQGSVVKLAESQKLLAEINDLLRR